MFDFGMSELLVIGIVALIVIGPKDLPELFRSLGRFTAKMRGMAREFSRAMEAAADEAGVKDVAKDLKNVTSAKSMGLEAVREATSKFEKWDPLKNAARPTVKPSTAAAVAGSDLKPELQPDPGASLPAEPAAVSVPKPASGPATQALTDAKAARQAIVKEAAAKLKKSAPHSTEAPETAKPKKAPAPRKPKSDSSPKADA